MSQSKLSEAELMPKKKRPFLAYGQLTYRDYYIYNGFGYSGLPFDFQHESYDGDPDSNDHRLGQGDSIEDCMEQIDEQIQRD